MRRLIKHFLNTKAQRHKVANAVGKYHVVNIAVGKYREANIAEGIISPQAKSLIGAGATFAARLHFVSQHHFLRTKCVVYYLTQVNVNGIGQIEIIA